MTTCRIEALVNPERLHEEIANGYVTERCHPDDPELRIYNYTDKAQYERHWNEVTMNTRGLIVRDGVILAYSAHHASRRR